MTPGSVPSITSWQDFSGIYEGSWTNLDSGETSSFTKFAIFTNSSEVYIGELALQRRAISLQEAIQSLSRIPDEDIYPPCPEGIRCLDIGEDCSNDIYIKQPKVLSHPLHKGTNMLAERFLDEIEMHHLVEQNPHPNLVRFEGCVVRDGLIVGIGLKRYSQTLVSTTINKTLAKNSDAAFSSAEVTRWLNDVRAAILHLHALDFAHNDLNPSNIMVDKSGNMVVVDLGSCTRLGERLRELGTPGWNDGFTEISSVQNDETGLEKLKQWLNGLLRRQSSES